MASEDAGSAVIRIEMTGVSKVYGSVVALSDFSVSIRAGELFSFLGPNGAGKTTAMRILVGLAQPTTGSSRICGLPSGTLDAKRRIGFVPDTPVLYEKLTGGETLELAADLQGVKVRRRETLEELATFLSLDAVLSRLVGTYSRGMRQKLAIACALVHNPDVLFLDEPMVGLDPEGIVRLRRLMATLCERGKSVLISTHQIDLAAQLSTRLAIISGGRLVVAGTVDEVKSFAEVRDLETAFLTLTGEAVNTPPAAFPSWETVDSTHGS